MDEHQECELAHVVADYARLFEIAPPAHLDPQSLQTELAVLLMPVVEPLARDAALRAGLADADYFAAGVTWDLIAPRPQAARPRICEWNPTEGRFGAWARTVLHHLALDAQRRLNRAVPLDDCDPPQRASGTAFHALFSAVLDTPFPPEDLARMEQWGPRDRLELTLLSGFWVKFLFDPAVWDRVLREYEADRGVTLPVPFPPLAFLTAATVGERVARLAPALGYNGDAALLRRWYRDLKRKPEPLLRTLTCLAELEPP
jgi:hypothetical protein